MFSIVNVPLDERVFVHVGRVPTRVLGPDPVTAWTWRPLRVVALVRVSTDLIVAKLKAEEVALVPHGATGARVMPAAGIELIDTSGIAAEFGPGRHAAWTSRARRS